MCLKHAIKRLGSEALTRYALIDPLLRGLGWDTEDPDQVIPEYRVGSGKCDYALMNNGKLVVLLEAKPLGMSLADALTQAVTYGIGGHAPFFAMTDGANWELYDNSKPSQEMKVGVWDLAKDPPLEFARKALALWRPTGLGTPALPFVIPTPVAGVPSATVTSISPIMESFPVQPAPPPAGSSVQPTAPQAPGVWKELGDMIAQKGAKAPIAIRFPDGKELPIKYWIDILNTVAEWLVAKGVLTAAKCPISGLSKEKYLVHTQPHHPSGKRFVNKHQLANGLYVGGILSTPLAVQSSLTLLSQLGLLPAGIQLRIS